MLFRSQIAAPPNPGIGSEAAGIALRITATDGAHWRRPTWTAPAPAATLKCRNFPSLAASPPQISRSDLAPPSWQNSMATNCPQLLNPRACRSALCLRAAVSNPVREMSCKICEKMLHTLFKAESSSDSLVFANSTHQRISAFFFPKAISTAELIWTRLTNQACGYFNIFCLRIQTCTTGC